MECGSSEPPLSLLGMAIIGLKKDRIMDTTLVVALAGGFATVITAIIKFVPRKGNNDVVRKDICKSKHEALEQRIDDVRESVRELKVDVKEQGKTLSDVHAMLVKMNGGR